MKQTALITGASSGIGRELAKLLAHKGYHLVLVARRRENLEQLAAELVLQHGISASVICQDLAKPEAPEAIFKELDDKGIAIDLLVNNAGFSVYGPLQNVDLAQTLQLLQVNMIALTHLTKLAVDHMLQAGRSGKILNLGSTGSFAPSPLNAAYCASKAYVLSFSEGIAKDLEGTGITVTALCPGATHTEFAEKAMMMKSKLFQSGVMEAEQVARIGYKALMAGKRIAIAGVSNQLMVHSIRFAPRALVLRMGKSLLSSKA